MVVPPQVLTTERCLIVHPPVAMTSRAYPQRLGVAGLVSRSQWGAGAATPDNQQKSGVKPEARTGARPEGRRGPNERQTRRETGPEREAVPEEGGARREPAGRSVGGTPPRPS